MSGSTHPTSRRPRPLGDRPVTLINRLTSLILGLVVAAAGLLTVTESVLALADRDPLLLPTDRLDAELSTVSWDDPFFQWVGLGSLLVGAALIALQLLPRRPPSYSVRQDRADRAVTIGRRGLQAHLARVATEVDGVIDATVRASRRSVHVQAAVPGVERARSDGVPTRVRSAVTEAVEELHLAKPLKIRIRTAPGTRRVQ